MKVLDEFKKYPKEMVYDMYYAICYDTKEYDKITRSMMLESIIKEYSQEDFLFSICTYKELEFLKYVNTNKVSVKDVNKYGWEMSTLNDKCIFSMVSYDVYDEQKENIDKALKTYEKVKEQKKKQDEIITFMIGFVKTNGEVLTNALVGMIKSISSLTEENINHLFGSPLFHFYCDFEFEYMESFGEDVEKIYYRKYWNLLDDLHEQRIKYGIGGGKDVRFEDYYDIFYHDFPKSSKKVQKMFDLFNKNAKLLVLYPIIENMRVLYDDRNNLPLLINDKEQLKIIEDGLDDSPCACMNGFTPNQYNEDKSKGITINQEFNRIPQNNAHLHKNDAKLFYKLYFALLEYTNDNYKINNNISKIYQQEGLNPEDLIPINDYLWENRRVIDNFIKDNKYNFNEEELNIVKKFESAINDEMLFIVGFEREYTEILSTDGKIYMIKGINSDIDEIFDANNLPYVVQTTLLMFKDKIIYNGFFAEPPIDAGNSFKEMILGEYSNAMRYYHL